MSIETTGSRILPAGEGIAVLVRRGQEMVIVNTHGTQAIDTWALNENDPGEYMSMEHTRSRLSRLSPKPGDALFSNRRVPMLTLVEDTSPEVHDTLLCACNPAIYRELGCEEGHRSCETNFLEALADIDRPATYVPPPLNLFMKVGVTPEGDLERAPPVSAPGDRVRFRAEMDVIVVLSCCPQDVTPINGAECIPRDIAYSVA